jgi:hypothetical protein
MPQSWTPHVGSTKDIRFDKSTAAHVEDVFQGAPDLTLRIARPKRFNKLRDSSCPIVDFEADIVGKQPSQSSRIAGHDDRPQVCPKLNETRILGAFIDKAQPFPCWRLDLAEQTNGPRDDQRGYEDSDGDNPHRVAMPRASKAGWH